MHSILFRNLTFMANSIYLTLPADLTSSIPRNLSTDSPSSECLNGTILSHLFYFLCISLLHLINEYPNIYWLPDWGIVIYIFYPFFVRPSICI